MNSLFSSRLPFRFLFALLLLEGGFALGRAADPSKIDREALVGRHNPTNHTFDASSPLTVGNGQFAFSVDATGLQTFPEYYHRAGIPIETLSRWAWHTNANPEHFKLEDANKPYTSYGRTVSYPTNTKPAASQWLRENPQDVPLALIGFDIAAATSLPIRASDFHDLTQTLDLWKGVVTSHSTLNGSTIDVTTTVHPEFDLIAVRVVSPLLKDGKLGVKIAFHRGHDIKQKNNPTLDWTHPEAHTTKLEQTDVDRVALKRQIDDTHYEAVVRWAGKAELTPEGLHVFRLRATEGEVLEFVVAFSPDRVPAKLPDFAATLKASMAHWSHYWKTGGVVDFSGSTDPRASELERRIILSQYLTAVQFGGDFPPQETGLTSDSWYGKHHTEMIWWHLAHFALWGRDDYVANALKWFQKSLPVARQIASSRGLQGARWPKMVGPEGRESPGGNPLIVWNQPHIIYLAELLYRNKPTKETLNQYRELVSETAQCMSSMLHWDEDHQRYVLGPPLWISQEIYDQSTSMNPGFELSYWSFCLELAQQWRVRLGQPRSEEWDKNLKNLSLLPEKDGRYVALESTPDTFDNVASRHDHPTMLASYGVLPGNGVEPATMRRTLDAVLKTWDWETKIWGWDYPMIAMTATRLKDPATAIDILLKDGPNNHYTPNGHCPQREDLPVYLPANGALLSAVALMAAGWDGGPTIDAPGFPKDGRWTVRAEGVHRLP